MGYSVSEYTRKKIIIFKYSGTLLFYKIVCNRIYPEDESINKVKIQPVKVSTKRERSSDPADSGKKVLHGVKRFRSRLFSGFADLRNEGDQLFFLCPRLFRRRAFPQYGAWHWRVTGYRGMC